MNALLEWWDWNKDMLLPLLWTLIVTAGLFCLVVWGVAVLNEKQCATHAAELRTDYRYSINAGCRIKIDDKFVPLQNVRVVR
jgi:hypothetical protein